MDGPKVARLEGTPTIHVTCLYTSWYVRVVDTHSILEYYCIDLSFHERCTTWLFHVGASQYYCVSHLSSRRSDCGLTIQGSCHNGLKDKPNMRVVAKWDTSELWVGPSVYTYLCTVNVKHTLLCTQPSKIATKGVRVQHWHFFFLGFESTQLARQLHQECTQMEVQ